MTQYDILPCGILFTYLFIHSFILLDFFHAAYSRANKAPQGGLQSQGTHISTVTPRILKGTSHAMVGLHYVKLACATNYEIYEIAIQA